MFQMCQVKRQDLFGCEIGISSMNGHSQNYFAVFGRDIVREILDAGLKLWVRPFASEEGTSILISLLFSNCNSSRLT